ncbi:hypothetical protein ACIQBJ_14160 [Kitasatospora sp. NPDC088391]|uniref:hypothetical protein n=1 Tax=Kitasatospora sp. NPDC088391 TaxID=3364074 RepID=UPI0038080B3C
MDCEAGSMSTVDLRSAWAKYRHACKQLEVLADYVDAQSKILSESVPMAAHFDSATGFHILRISQVPDAQETLEQVSLYSGDVINNLRTSMDHLMWQLACLRGVPRNPNPIKFRFCRADGRPCGNPGFLGSEIWDRVHEFQPCKGVNGRSDSWSGEYVHQIDQLVDLSNADKHQNIVDIIPTVNGFGSIPTRLTLPPWIQVVDGEHVFLPEWVNDPDPDAEVIDATRADHRLAVGAEVARIKAPLWGTVELIGFTGFARIYFGLPGLLPLVPTLERLASYCREVLEAFTSEGTAGPSVGRPEPTGGDQ